MLGRINGKIYNHTLDYVFAICNISCRAQCWKCKTKWNPPSPQLHKCSVDPVSFPAIQCHHVCCRSIKIIGLCNTCI
ncbi:unnamed protein product [Acanthoscelides obtectus]|uniref:Uncharacterized protein n=1 Tax=Acanthoscelides obtectus TaxID=200917 RepID=A0A9P0QCA2_ACAOB|nr:unnamed protein product [Acanthoscelides obtectus]CAK1660823.1 hypothetical protein AOBTE_LOCUS22281 [Acanthoscelides obtectus]